jgi:NAD(P)-dependent dehydrogenase (short-subunit alcohol dehydrogenase family)
LNPNDDLHGSQPGDRGADRRPRPIETPLLLAINGDDPTAVARRQVRWPTGRLGKPRKMVAAAVFLASGESSFVNRATFAMDCDLTAAYDTPE